MNPNTGTSRPLLVTIELENFDATWAGQNPLSPGFCFGSEDGRLLFTDEQGIKMSEPWKGSHSGEAINGVARMGGWIAVTTRADVTVQNLANKEIVVLPYGAHGVTAASGGYFVAPLGRAGIMLMRPGPGNKHEVAALGAEGNDKYFYRIVAAKSTDGKDLLACACRQSGIGITEMRWGQDSYNMRVATFDGLDVVDICAVNADPEGLALAAAGRDGTLIMVRKGLQDQNPLTIKFKAVQGTVYRLLSSGEHLFVLTSRGLYVLNKLAGRLVKGMPPGEFVTEILTIPIEAVDANIVGEQWLLVVTPDDVRKLDVGVIERTAPQDLADSEIREAFADTLNPNWQVSEKSSQFASTS